MQLPLQLQQAIEKELDHCGRANLIHAREQLTTSYRDPIVQTKTSHMTTDKHRLAYIASRMPATYAAVYKVMQEIRCRLPDIVILRLLDMGAGPGTVIWSAIESFPEIRKMTLLEKDSQLAAIGKKLAAHGGHPVLSQAEWIPTDLETSATLARHDMVVFSYSIGEIASPIQLPLIENAWNNSEKLLVVIEPGTPVGFERIRAIRSHLLNLGASIVAPCPHMNICPMQQNDWCHFSVRVERSSYHRQIKSGSLGYEDEKFSYIVFAKDSIELPSARILRHPIKRSGHTHFTLCTSDGIKGAIISKRSGEAYKECRRLEWGDAYPKHALL